MSEDDAPYRCSNCGSASGIEYSGDDGMSYACMSCEDEEIDVGEKCIQCKKKANWIPAKCILKCASCGEIRPWGSDWSEKDKECPKDFKVPKSNLLKKKTLQKLVQDNWKGFALDPAFTTLSSSDLTYNKVFIDRTHVVKVLCSAEKPGAFKIIVDCPSGEYFVLCKEIDLVRWLNS